MKFPAVLLFVTLLSSPAHADRRGTGSAGERTIAARVLKLQDNLLHVGLGDSQQDVIVPTTDKTEIRLDGQPAKLADLPAGALAQITQVDGATTLIDCKTSPRRR